MTTEARWPGVQVHTAGAGAVQVQEAGWLLRHPPLDGRSYTNAQLDDHTGRPRRTFVARPPLRLALSARFSHSQGELHGTAGFGFWNDPFMMTGPRAPAAPAAAWFFFAGRPSSMPLVQDVPGRGWKAAVLDARRLAFWALLPAAPLGFLLMRSPWLYRRIWPVAQRIIGAAEVLLDQVAMTDWHHYVLEWHCDCVRFLVDGAAVLETARAPRGPLGLVIWKDNQYMVATPQGRFDHGVVATADEQWLEIRDLRVDFLDE